MIREGALGAPEVVRTPDEQQGHHGYGARQRLPRGARGIEQGPAEALDDPRHRIQAVHEAHPPRLVCEHARGRVDDRRRKHPGLRHEGKRVTHVAVDRVERRQPEGYGERRGDCQKHEQRQREDAPARRDAETEHHAEQHHEREGEIDERREDRGDRRDQARKIDLGDQVLVVNEAVPGCGERRGEELPGHECAVGRDCVGDPLRRGHVPGPQQEPEQQREDHHRHQRLNHRPRDPEQRLLVADLEIAKGEEADQLAVAPELGQVDRDPAPTGADHDRAARTPLCGQGQRVRRDACHYRLFRHLGPPA
jgi:hypothetical protein